MAAISESQLLNIVNRLNIDERKEVWLRAWTALVATDGLNTAEQVSEWADHCLNDYAERFATTINLEKE